MKETKQLDIELEIKALSDDGSFSGYASVFGNYDSDNDRILKGAFQGVKASRVKMLWYHDPKMPIGEWLSIKEDDRGLFVKGQLFIDANVPKADEVYTLIKRKSVDGMSVGMRVSQEGAKGNKKGGYDISKASLREISPVTFGANDKALINRVKSENFMDLPIADKGVSWDAIEAEKKLKTKSGDGGFLWVDKNERKLPIADVINGEITIIPKGVYAAAGYLLSDKCEVSEEDMPGVVAHIEDYYEKMELSSPFAVKNSKNSIKSYIRAKLESSNSPKEYEQTLRDVGFSLSESKAVASKLSPQREVEGLSVLDAIKQANESIQTLNKR